MGRSGYPRDLPPPITPKTVGREGDAPTPPLISAADSDCISSTFVPTSAPTFGTFHMRRRSRQWFWPVLGEGCSIPLRTFAAAATFAGISGWKKGGLVDGFQGRLRLGLQECGGRDLSGRLGVRRGKLCSAARLHGLRSNDRRSWPGG